MSPKVKDALKVGVPTIIAILAYLLQVDPISLCKPQPTKAPVVELVDAGAK